MLLFVIVLDRNPGQHQQQASLHFEQSVYVASNRRYYPEFRRRRVKIRHEYGLKVAW